MTKKRRAAAANAAQAVSAALTAAAETKTVRKHKKKGSTWASLLTGAAKVASELVPALLPALLANHAGTTKQLAVRSAVQGRSTGGAVPVAAPLAQGVAVQPMTGLTNFSCLKKQGKVYGIRLTGLDYIDAITATSYVAGDLVKEWDLNLASGTFSGTRLQREVSLWERYNVNHMCLIFEPTAPATQAGQLIAYIETDPDDVFNVSGRVAVQKAGSHIGAEQGQVWQMIIGQYFPDKKTPDFFASPDGSDDRLISPGRARIVAGTDLDDGPLGSVYVCYDVTFEVPQTEIQESDLFAELNAVAGMASGNPVGTTPWGTQQTGATNFEASIGAAPDGSGSGGLWGLPVGDYYVTMWTVGTGYSGATGLSATASGSLNNNNYVVTNSRGPAGTASTGAVYSFYLHVEHDSSDNFEIGWLKLAGTATTVTACKTVIVSIPYGLLLAKKRTLQQIEADFERRLETLEGVIRAAAACSSPTDHPSGPAMYYGGQYPASTASLLGGARILP
uniref:Uncharacterized protein n=1 Tax=Riboviria sp. TaxID=2585031 RepID=A0A514D2J5_9VIRU|nr:MAG: hypothetical protein H3Bulk40844_000002 [Riboviria sp.]